MSSELQPMAVQYYCHVSPSVFSEQYTALPLDGVLVTWYGRISYIHTFWYNFDTVLCHFLETGTSDRCLIGIVQLMRFSGFSLHHHSFFLYSPFNEVWICRVEIQDGFIIGRPYLHQLYLHGYGSREKYSHGTRLS